ncbi:MAG: cation:proton antiporter, partial [Gammaproteobacteria bacterium]
LLYSTAIIATVILGRFIWVFVFVYFLPRYLFPSIQKRDPYPRWQFPFIISWAGMRGSITLAAALAIPGLPFLINGTDPRDLIIFLAFSVIAATFVLQGLTLPWLLKMLGAKKYGEMEENDEHLSELAARLVMAKGVLRWLLEYHKQVADNPKLSDEVKLYISEYRMLKNKLSIRIKNHNDNIAHDEMLEVKDEVFLLSQIIEVERSELLRLWHTEKINIETRNKLLSRLDHASKHLPE